MMKKEIIRQRARSLRKTSTDAEKIIWFNLRNNRLGVKFRRQVPIEPYIVDFVCFEKRLIIEIDGGQHLDNVEYDTSRTKYLQHLGFDLIRFWNNQIVDDLSAVLESIVAKL